MLIPDFKMLTVQCVILLFQWRYCIRIENLGQETVQLRERHWRIFSLSGTLETVRGRGVAGQVRLGDGREGKGGGNMSTTYCMCDSTYCMLREDEVRQRTGEVILCISLLPKVIPLKLFFRSLLISEIPGGPINSQSCEVKFVHMDSPSRFTCIFYLPH